MFIVGLTGGLATGKSTVLSIFRENGIAVIDADEVARKVLDPGSKAWHEVKSYFGDEVLGPDGRVNRAKLGEIIFDDINKRRKLNAITHPRIQSAMLRMAVSYFFSGHKYIVMEVPLLFETGKMLTFMHKIITVIWISQDCYRKRSRVVLLVTSDTLQQKMLLFFPMVVFGCEDHQQLERLSKRNDFSEAVARKRINCQMPLEDKVAKSHFVIDNSGDLSNTRHQTLCIIRMLKRSKFTWYFRALLLIGLLSVVFGVANLTYKLMASQN